MRKRENGLLCDPGSELRLYHHIGIKENEKRAKKMNGMGKKIISAQNKTETAEYS